MLSLKAYGFSIVKKLTNHVKAVSFLPALAHNEETFTLPV